MTSESNQQHLLEIYKLHAELADRVSERREGANRLFVTVLVGLMVFVASLIRFGTEDGLDPLVFCGVGFLGVCLTIAWFVVIRSYRQLNTGKFAALTELEKELAYPFFTREWKILDEGRSRKRYWKLSVVETSLPIIFLLLFLGLIVACFMRNPT